MSGRKRGSAPRRRQRRHGRISSDPIARKAQLDSRNRRTDTRTDEPRQEPKP